MVNEKLVQVGEERDLAARKAEAAAQQMQELIEQEESKGDTRLVAALEV